MRRLLALTVLAVALAACDSQSSQEQATSAESPPGNARASPAWRVSTQPLDNSGRHVLSCRD